jgi:hypothetical protein
MPIATLTSILDQVLSATAAGQENLANLETSVIFKPASYAALQIPLMMHFRGWDLTQGINW